MIWNHLVISADGQSIPPINQLGVRSGEIIFTLFLVKRGKLDIMVHKANVLTYIWSFSENLENYKILILTQ